VKREVSIIIRDGKVNELGEECILIDIVQEVDGKTVASTRFRAEEVLIDHQFHNRERSTVIGVSKVYKRRRQAETAGERGE
jgi:hypothetical protein